jgi:hypothetical protein
MDSLSLLDNNSPDVYDNDGNISLERRRRNKIYS